MRVLPVFGWLVVLAQLLVVGCIGLAGVGAAQAGNPPTLRLTLQGPASFDTDTIGPEDEVISAGVILLANGPASDIVVRFTLPEHVSYLSMAGNPAAWNCVAAGQTVDCAYVNTLTSSNPQTSFLDLRIAVDGSLPVPGSSAVQSFISSANDGYSADVGNCVISSTTSAQSDNGCATVTSPHRRSTLSVLNNTWIPNPGVFTVGQEHAFSVGFQSLGFSHNNGPVTITYLLPPGLVFNRVSGNFLGVSCSASAITGSGQLVTCTALMNDGQTYATANLNFFVDVTDAAAVPGPIPIRVTISNAYQSAPPIESCTAENLPPGCGFHQVSTAPRQQSAMDIFEITPLPTTFRPDVEERLAVLFTNIGNGTAGTMTLRLALPVGIIFDRAISTQPAGNCSATATASGQTVTCQFATGIASGASGSATLAVDVAQIAINPSRVVAAIGDATAPGPTLETCAASPDAIGCGEVIISIAPGLFCDGFERLARICGEPQAF